MRSGLKAGDVAELHWQVGPAEVIHLGQQHPAGGAVVFSTPAMINLMEHAAREALRPYLGEDEESVGVQIEVEHLAATPIAATVRAAAKVMAVEGRLIDFEITAYDAAEPIGRGRHRRAVIQVDRFASRLQEKTAALPQGVLLPARLAANSGPLPALETLLVEIDGPVARVTLNRPQKLNAVNVQMTGDWEQLVSWLAGHPELRVVVLRGAGRAFCAGDDVKELATLDVETARQLSARQAQMYLSWERLPQVFIAGIHGLALGAGCVAAYSCDFRIASFNAQLGMPEILLGWPPGYGVAQLTAIVGKARALEICLTGTPLSARRALDYGLVHQVVPAGRLERAVDELTDRLLATPPIALRETKWLLHGDEGPRPKVTWQGDTAAYIRCLQTADAREGIAAFVEKRPARFQGQ